MNVKIESNCRFLITQMHYSPKGELNVVIHVDNVDKEGRFEYSAVLGDGLAEEKPSVSLLHYIKVYTDNSGIKDSTKEAYTTLSRHLRDFGDRTMDNVTTEYLQGFVSYLQSLGLKTGTVHLNFQKLACVLHYASRNELFDDRILQRVKRPKREQNRKCFLTETELRNLTKHISPNGYSNIQSMFLFSCLTGLRFGDVQRLRWRDIHRNGHHLYLEFRQQKTDTNESLPLCPEAENMLRNMRHLGEYVFLRESNQKTNAELKKWCKAARIKKEVTFHIARHTFCVTLLTKEVPIFTVQQLMCHSDINTTKVYADLLNKTKAKALRKLPQFGKTYTSAVL